MKNSTKKFKNDFGKLNIGSKSAVIGGAITMTVIGLVNLSFRLHIYQ